MSVELPGSYETLYQRALYLMGTGESQEAIDLMLRIVHRLCRLRPETLQRKPHLQQTLLASWSAAVQFLRWEQRFDEAIAITQEVLERLPDPSAGQKRIASLRIERGEVQEGLAGMRQVAEEQDDLDSWFTLGAEYGVLERYDEALDCYQTALGRATSNEEAALVNLSIVRIHQAANRLDAALDAWNMAVVLDPELADEVESVYVWLIRQGALEQAASYLERDTQLVRRTFYEGLLHWQAGRQQAARGKWSDVLSLEEEIDSSAGDVEAWMEAALRLDLPAQADGIVQELSLQGETLSVQAGVLHGIAKLMLGELASAEGLFEQAVRRLERGWPARTEIPAVFWDLLTLVVADQESTRRAAPYFETGT
jgi:tetratricopeptide (TPR) repeat protein